MASAANARLLGESARIVRIVSADESVSCSATLLRLDADRSCRLVTNAHCASENRARFTIQPTPALLPLKMRPLFATVPSVQATSVIKIDRERDLAELAIPNPLRISNCEDLVPSTESSVQQRFEASKPKYSTGNKSLASYATLGFHDGEPIVNYTQGETWQGQGHEQNALGLEQLFRANTSLLGLNYLYNLTELSLLNGMSGGVTIDQNFEALGINVRFIAFHDQTYVIPLHEVFRFLLSREPKLSFASRWTEAEDAGENSGGNGGENSGGNGGENSGGNGGENSGGNGGESSKPAGRASLAVLRERPEGVPEGETSSGSRALPN